MEILHSVFRLFEKDEGFELTEALEIHFMELPKLLVKWRERLVSPWEDVLVRWLFLLEGSENEEILKILEEIAVQDPVLNKAMEEWEKSSDDPKIREEYLARRKAILDEMAAVREAELRLREAIKQSKEEGRLEGKIEGRLEGKIEGRLEDARNALIEGIEPVIVSKITGLPLDEILKIQQSLAN